MGRNNPKEYAEYDRWTDGVEEWGNENVDEDITQHLVARKHKFYNIEREENDGVEGVDNYQYRIYAPDQLCVEKYKDMKRDGWEFTEVTVAEYSRMWAEFFGDV